MLGCFFDASKAFDLVDHSMFFQKLIDRGLPTSPCCSISVFLVQYSKDESALGKTLVFDFIWCF